MPIYLWILLFLADHAGGKTLDFTISVEKSFTVKIPPNRSTTITTTAVASEQVI